MRFIAVVFVVSVLIGCGEDGDVNTEGQSNGDDSFSVLTDDLCPIDCTDTLDSDYVVGDVTAAGPKNITHTCINEDVQTPVTVRFRVFKNNSNNDLSSSDSEKLQIMSQPISRVAFTPLLSGVRDASSTNPSIVDVCDGCGSDVGVVKVAPYKYHGITTPKSEWCTDACGFASYTFIPKCDAGGSSTITAGIQVKSIVKANHQIDVTVEQLD